MQKEKKTPSSFSPLVRARILEISPFAPAM